VCGHPLHSTIKRIFYEFRALPPPASTSCNARFAAFDWSPDKEGLCVMGSYDQSVRVCVVTKLNKL
jgi:hypothetical protein